MKNRRNYYRILHVQPDAPREVIRSSYRTIMQRMRVHPDLGGDERAAALVNEAYAVLNDEENRVAYDRVRASAEWNRSANDSAAKAQARHSAASEQRCAFCARPVPDEAFEDGLVGFCRTCDSPLAPASGLAMEEADRRTIMRIPKQLSLDFCTHWPQRLPHDGRADDISLSGMKFMTGVYLASEQTIKIDSTALKAVANVVRCRYGGGGWEVGVRFISLCFAQPRGSFVQERV